MKLWRRLGALAAGMSIAMPAVASDKENFIACDGRLQPGRQDDGMRGAASRAPYANLGTRTDIVEVCTRALASPRLLPTQTLRRAHLLRARATAYLRSGDVTKALADIDSAETAAADRAGDRFFQRSMGVSLKLLRAFAYARSDDRSKAVELARSAMEARPYSLEVQEAGAAILQAARPLGIPSPSPWSDVARLDPGMTMTALVSEHALGNFPGVIALRPSVTLVWPTKPLAPFALDARTQEAMQLLTAMRVQLDVAYARAATGDVAGARRDLAEVRANVAAAYPQVSERQFAEMASSMSKAMDKFVDIRSRQIEARIAVAEERYPDAIAALVATPMPNDAATIELLTTLKEKLPASNVGMLPDVARFRDELDRGQREGLGKDLAVALMAPETPRSVIDYEKSRPNILGAMIGAGLSMGTTLLGGIKRTDGFRTTTNADGTVNVEFIGNTPSKALVQEMTLLRAAEVTREAGKPAFVIAKRQDFTRTLNTSRGGMLVSTVPTGFKTELTIRFVDSGIEPERALDAVKIIDDLGPHYYEEKPSKS